MKEIHFLFPILANFAAGFSVWLGSTMIGGYFEMIGIRLPAPTMLFVSNPYCIYFVALLYCITALLIQRKISEGARLWLLNAGWFLAVATQFIALIALILPFAKTGTVVSG